MNVKWVNLWWLNNHITWLKKKNKKKKLFPVFFLFHTQQLNTFTTQETFIIPINLSLLNHSNLFLPMPKIYIFHKLLQQGILQCYGLIMVPILLFGPLELARCVPAVALHTLFMAKINCGKFTMTCCSARWHTKREITAYILLWWTPHSGWLFIYSLGWDSPSSYIHWTIKSKWNIH